jgi:hypothetical protein
MKIRQLNKFVGNGSLKARLKRTYKFSEKTVKVGLTAYKEFLQMKAAMEDWEGDLVVPTQKIDQIWSQHVLDTKAYHSGCQEVFGKIIEHDPEFSFTGKLFRQKMAQTKMLYKVRFEHVADGDFWNVQPSVISALQDPMVVSSTDSIDVKPIVVSDDSDVDSDDSVVVSAPQGTMLASRPKSSSTNNKKSLNLTISRQGQKFHFEIARTTTFKRVLTGVLPRIFGISIDKARLVCEHSGHIYFESTPNDHDLEDGDILELYQEQIGC